jgi:hypothetical protein
VVELTGDSFRDTMVATLDSNGGWVPPLYLKTQSGSASQASGRRPPPGVNAVKGMNNKKMMEYGDHLDRYVDSPTRLLLDRLGAHTSKTVRDYIESKKCTDGRQKFKIFLLPPKSAFLISPLDFGFFGYWKQMYHKFDRSTTSLKFFAANQTWKQVEAAKVVEFFAACHLVGNEREDTLRTELHSLLRSAVPEELEEIWDFYDGWKSGAFRVDGVSAPREAPLIKPIQLEDAALDGVYWTNWGPHGNRK